MIMTATGNLPSLSGAVNLTRIPKFGSVILTPKKIGLYWYNFKLTAIDKTRYVIPSDPYKVSTIEDYMGRSWQITCYKKGFKTPGWLVGGIMYQIFPTVFISAVKKRI